MKADLSRLSFDALAGYVHVLQQQGRPILDAELNEQASILLHRLQLLGRDLIGPFGGPSEFCGFEIKGFEGGPHDFTIGAGRYYVNGICVENPATTTFAKQPVPVRDAAIHTGKLYLVFLDIWEELIAVPDAPELMEPALGGIDTAARTRIAWQVRTEEIDPKVDNKYVFDYWPSFIERWQPRLRGSLRVRIAAGADEGAADHSATTPHPRYRGQENHLYRVEIHYGGTAGAPDGATFKVSRDNGSVVFRLREVAGSSLTLDRLDASGGATLVQGDWLEVVTEGHGHCETPRQPLIAVTGRGPGLNQVTIAGGGPALDAGKPGGLWLRRWEQRPIRANRGGVAMRDGTLLITEGTGEAGWIALENGIEVQFAPNATYRPGDHWMIPARVADGGRVLWPQEDGVPCSVPPHGNGHGYAPLAIVEFKPIAERRESCRRQFKMLASSLI